MTPPQSPQVRTTIPLSPGEVAHFPPVDFGGPEWSSREGNLTGCLVETQGVGFSVHLQVLLSEEEGEHLLDIDRAEEVVNVVDGVKVVDEK